MREECGADLLKMEEGFSVEMLTNENIYTSNISVFNFSIKSADSNPHNRVNFILA